MLPPPEVLKLLTVSFLYVLSAGGYALFWTIHRLVPRRRYRLGSGLFLYLLLSSAAVLIGSEAFTLFWKGLLLVATLFYLAVPPVVGWAVARSHR